MESYNQFNMQNVIDIYENYSQVHMFHSKDMYDIKNNLESTKFPNIFKYHHFHVGRKSNISSDIIEKNYLLLN